eukprot:2209491-Prymnesium_polylepis.1
MITCSQLDSLRLSSLECGPWRGAGGRSGRQYPLPSSEGIRTRVIIMACLEEEEEKDFFAHALGRRCPCAAPM